MQAKAFLDPPPKHASPSFLSEVTDVMDFSLAIRII
jgi:hypothetical protein